MQYAVIATGGKQYIAIPGKQLVLETLPEAEGQSVTFNQVLLTVDGDQVKVGTPVVEGLTVVGTVVRHDLADKIRVFKYKSKSRYRRTSGHRQHQTIVMIDSIGGKGAAKPAATEAAPVKKTTPAKKSAEVKE